MLLFCSAVAAFHCNCTVVWFNACAVSCCGGVGGTVDNAAVSTATGRPARYTYSLVDAGPVLVPTGGVTPNETVVTPVTVLTMIVAVPGIAVWLTVNVAVIDVLVLDTLPIESPA